MPQDCQMYFDGSLASGVFTGPSSSSSTSSSSSSSTSSLSSTSSSSSSTVSQLAQQTGASSSDQEAPSVFSTAELFPFDTSRQRSTPVSKRRRSQVRQSSELVGQVSALVQTLQQLVASLGPPGARQPLPGNG